VKNLKVALATIAILNLISASDHSLYHEATTVVSYEINFKIKNKNKNGFSGIQIKSSK